MIHFKLVAPGDVKFDEEVYEVVVPTGDGPIALFEDHMPLLSAGSPGVISVRKEPIDSDEALVHFAVSGGVLQVDGKTARYLSDEVTTPDEVSEQAAAEAHGRAQEMMKNAPDRMALEEAKHMLHHSAAHLHLAKLKKRHHH